MLKAYVTVPSGDEFGSILEYLINPAVEESGFEVIHKNFSNSPANITNISASDLIIADLTGSDANVLYEIGIAHGLHKSTILTCQSFDDIPSALKGYQVIIYSTRFDKAVELVSELKDAIDRFVSDGIIGNPVIDFAIKNVIPDKKEIDFQVFPVTTMAISRFAGVPKSMNSIFESDAVEKLQQAAVKIKSYTEEFAEKLQYRAQEMQRVAASSGSGNYSKLQKIIENSSNDMLIYARQLASERVNMEAGTDYMITSIDYFSWITSAVPEGDTTTFQFRLLVDELQNSSTEALNGLLYMGDELLKFPDIKPVARSSKLIINEVEFLIDNFKKLNSSCSRALNLMNFKEDSGES